MDKRVYAALYRVLLNPFLPRKIRSEKMKKITKIIVLFIGIFFLTACGKPDFHKKLQENDWQVVSDNGQSYQAMFASDTASFDSKIISVGFTYTIDEDNKIILTDREDEEVFIITEKAENELYFKADTEETLEEFGNLTLTPIKQSNN